MRKPWEVGGRDFVNSTPEQLFRGRGGQRSSEKQQSKVRKGVHSSWDLPLVPSLPAAPQPPLEGLHPLDICSFLLVPGIQLALASIPYKNS